MKKLPGKENDGTPPSTTLQEIVHQLEQQNFLLNSNFPLEDVFTRHLTASSWLAELHQAASRARCDQAMALIQQITEPHPNLGHLFSQLVNEFQFDRIVALIEQNQEQKNDHL
jgi:hypothetical protein